jgi:DNA-binding CsgD family transcriptional regulator
MYKVEKLLTSARKAAIDATSQRDAVDALAELVRPLGVSSVDCLISERLFLRWDRGTVPHQFHCVGFPKDWGRRWPRYAMVDPVLPATASAIWAVPIGQLRMGAGSKSSALRRELWDYLADVGLAEGVSVPVHLPAGAFGAVAFYRNTSTDTRKDKEQDETLFLLGQYFCRALAQRFGVADGPTRGLRNGLTKREQECLYWSSVGKTTEETAHILGRAPQTVRYHLDNASRKLGAVNRTSAVAQACARGIIDPN